MNYLYYLGAVIVIVCVHEFGHWLAFKYYKHSPRFKVKWYGILIGSNVAFNNLKEIYFISYWGVMAGAVVWMLALPMNYFYIYILMSGLDLYNMLTVALTSRKHWRKDLVELHNYLALEQKQKLKTYQNAT